MEKFSEKKDWIEPCNAQCSFCFLNYADILGENYLFRNLKHKEIGTIIKKVHHQVKKYDKGDLIASSGDECNNLMIIVKGAAVGEMMDFQGKVLRIEKLKAPNTIATAFMFGENNRLPVDITAVEETKLLLIPKKDLMELFHKNNTVLKNYLDIISNRTQHLSKQIRMLGLQTIKGKIAHYLLEQVKNNNSFEFTLPNTQNELSEMFGVARPSIARVFRELHDESYIFAKGKNVKILDKVKLSGLLS
jgi:CRP-like cAMP-binding protein